MRVVDGPRWRWGPFTHVSSRIVRSVSLPVLLVYPHNCGKIVMCFPSSSAPPKLQFEQPDSGGGGVAGRPLAEEISSEL